LGFEVFPCESPDEFLRQIKPVARNDINLAVFDVVRVAPMTGTEKGFRESH
jgi:hypothetical protein